MIELFIDLIPIVRSLDGSCNRRKFGRLLAAIDDDHSHGPACTLAGVKITLHLEVPGHVVVRVQPVEENAVVRAQSTGRLVGPQDKNGAAVILHGGQRVRSNQVVNLADVVAVHLHLDGLAILSLDRAERRIGDDGIDLAPAVSHRADGGILLCWFETLLLQ